jgi:hypothetical protein
VIFAERLAARDAATPGPDPDLEPAAGET